MFINTDAIYNFSITRFDDTTFLSHVTNTNPNSVYMACIRTCSDGSWHLNCVPKAFVSACESVSCMKAAHGSGCRPSGCTDTVALQNLTVMQKHGPDVECAF